MGTYLFISSFKLANDRLRRRSVLWNKAEDQILMASVFARIFDITQSFCCWTYTVACLSWPSRLYTDVLHSNSYQLSLIARNFFIAHTDYNYIIRCYCCLWTYKSKLNSEINFKFLSMSYYPYSFIFYIPLGQ